MSLELGLQPQPKMFWFFDFRETGLRPSKSELERLLDEERAKMSREMDRAMERIADKMDKFVRDKSRCDW